MRFKRNTQFEQGLKPIDVVPLINLVLLLLLFFILSVNFNIKSGLGINLPRVVTSEAVGYETIEITVTSDNNVYLKGKLVSNEDLRNLFSQLTKRKQSVLIKADKASSLGRAAEIWDICRQSGIVKVNIATIQ